jgi:ribosomal protein S18 acetylase RimI-like enzyme
MVNKLKNLAMRWARIGLVKMKLKGFYLVLIIWCDSMFEPVYVGQLIKKGKSEFDFDSKEVVDLIVQAYDSKPEKVIAWLAGNLKIKESYVLVVRDCANNNRVVSILMYYPVSQDEIYIANLATREEYKRKGIAKFLIAWFKE